MALEEDQIAAEVVAGSAEEVIEADIVERGRRRKAGDVAAELRAHLVCAHDHRERVPANVMPKPPLQLAIAGKYRLTIRGNRIDVRRRDAERHVCARALRLIDEMRDQLPRTLVAFRFENAAHGFEPFAGLLWIGIGCKDGHRAPSLKAPSRISARWIHPFDSSLS